MKKKSIYVFVLDMKPFCSSERANFFFSSLMQAENKLEVALSMSPTTSK